MVKNNKAAGLVVDVFCPFRGVVGCESTGGWGVEEGNPTALGSGFPAGIVSGAPGSAQRMTLVVPYDGTLCGTLLRPRNACRLSALCLRAL